MSKPFQIFVADGADMAAAHTSKRLGYRRGDVRCSGGSGGTAVCGMRYAPRGIVRKPSYYDSCSLCASPRIIDPFPRPQLEVEVSTSLEINIIDGHWLASTYHHYCSVFRMSFWLPTRTEYPTRSRCTNGGGDGSGAIELMCGHVTPP